MLGGGEGAVRLFSGKKGFETNSPKFTRDGGGGERWTISLGGASGEPILRAKRREWKGMEITAKNPTSEGKKKQGGKKLNRKAPVVVEEKSEIQLIG